MTWGEFKEQGDRKLKEQDFDDNTELWYVDINLLDKVEAHVEYEREIGITIT